LAARAVQAAGTVIYHGQGNYNSGLNMVGYFNFITPALMPGLKKRLIVLQDTAVPIRNVAASAIIA